MPYSDNNPERRNLTVLSLAIIVYYLAGGKFPDDEVKLMLINATFENPSVLVAFVWVMLCWFLFRFFVTNRPRDVHEQYNLATATNMDNWITRWYLNKNNNLPLIPFLEDTKIHCRVDGTWIMRFEAKDNSRPNHSCTLNGALGYLVKTLYMIKIVFKNRSVTDYYTPYLLFILAVGLGLYNVPWTCLVGKFGF